MDRCGKIVSELNAKADLLNEVFINQNTSLAPDACVFGPSPLNVTFDLGNIYPSDVQRVLRSLPNKTSFGSDKISYRMMKEAGQGLVGPLVSLFNACRCGREAMTVFLVLIPRMDKRINRTDLCMHAHSPFLIPSFLDLCALLLCSCSGCCLFELVFM